MVLQQGSTTVFYTAAGVGYMEGLLLFCGFTLIKNAYGYGNLPKTIRY